MKGNPYIDLHCHSTFSSAMTAGDAFGSPERVVQRAVELGWGAVALTEHGWLGSAPALYREAVKYGLKPVIGCELYIVPDFAFQQKGKDFNLRYHLTVLALSKEGYQNLVAWTTEAMQRENFYYKPCISLSRMADVAPHGLHHNVVLSGCLASEICTTIAVSDGAGISPAIEYVMLMKQLFPNFYIEVYDHMIPKWVSEQFPAYLELLMHEEQAVKNLLKIARITQTPVVLTNDSHMQSPKDRKAHIALKAASWRNRDDAHYTQSEERLITGYLPDYAYFGNYMRRMEAIVEHGSIPSVALEGIADILGEVDIRLDPLDRFSYSIPFSGYEDHVGEIRRRSHERLRSLSKKHGPSARSRFELELKTMGEEFGHYLLLISDFCTKAQEQGILTWTRGSAANSILCYCLGIHDIDSIEFGLLFSRFYNPARRTLPDVDIDIQPGRYDDFMRIVHEVMEPLVGEGQVEQICNYGTAANRSAFRTAASALGLPKEDQDEIAKLLPQMIDSGVVDEDDDIFIALKEDYPELYEITSQVFDQVKNVSQHACAWAFGTPDRPLKDWVPMYLIASSGKLVTQFDFKTFENFGLVKGDFLRLRALNVCANVLRMIGRSPLEFYDIPLSDPHTYKMIRQGNVDGVHTLQGKEVRRGTIEMEVEDIHDLVVAAALYRPANTRIDRDKQYLKRRRGEEQTEYPHEYIEQATSTTYGLPVFQEQAMEICYLAGMDDAGVDAVYQAIKKAKGAGRGAKEAFEKAEPAFLKAAEAQGISEKMQSKLWEFVQGFQGYGFNKGHATSYGILADKMAYLKCHYPAEYFASLLEEFPERSTYLAATREAGFELAPPDVNRSGEGFGIDKAAGNVIRVGLGKVKGLGPVACREITQGQPFTDMDDFKERTTRRAVNATRVENLAALGVLQPLGVRGQKEADEIQFQLLGFTLKRPRAFRNCKPRHTGARVSSSGWKHDGLERGLRATSGRCSVSKLFWIPPDAKLELKASPWAQVKTWLLTVLDENGLQFHLMVNEDKPFEAKLLNFLHAKCQGAVVCVDGMIRLPFMSNGPQGFRLFGLTGSFNDDPQIFRLPNGKDKLYKDAISELDRRKRSSRWSQ